MPPPSKSQKPTDQLKHVHSEQLKKLQHKHQQETDLLEDVRLFAKQRSVIEKEYAQALTKLGEQFLHKRKFPPPPVKSEEHKRQPGRQVMCVWKTVLEETIKVGKTRLNAAEAYLQEISEPAKPLRTNKVTVGKKVFDQAATIQKEIATSVAELVKVQKSYSDEEHISYEARCKANEAERKVLNKATGIFTSMAKLQQKSAKLSNQKDQCEAKSTMARNDYLLHLASINAHQHHYFNADLPDLMRTLDGEIYEKLSVFFTTAAKAELECCGLTQECFMKILSDATMVSRDYNLECFLVENPVFTETIHYQFEPQDNDQVTCVSVEYDSAKDLMEKEAHECANKLAADNRLIRQSLKQLQLLQDNEQRKSMSESTDGKNEKDPKTPCDSETKLDELRQDIRKAETDKMRIEAKLEQLRLGGVAVDSFIEKAESEVQKIEDADEQLEAQKRTYSTSSSKRKENSQGSRPQSEVIDSNRTSTVDSAPNDSTYINYQEEDYVDETFDSQPAQGSAHDSGYSSGRVFPMKAYALYEFQATNSDEMSISENETLEIVGVGDSAGWVRVRRCHSSSDQARKPTGEEGFVPEQYVQAYDDNINGADGKEMNVDADVIPPPSAGWDATNPSWEDPAGPPPSGAWDNGAVVENSGYSSVPQSAGYDTSVPPSAGFDCTPPIAGLDQNVPDSAADVEIEQASEQVVPPGEGMWAKALYDYEATCDEELSFTEGQLIKILRHDEEGVDDGWWEGELNGRIGVFPSLVVEELTMASDPADLRSPDRPGPPPFTPPEPGPPPPTLGLTSSPDGESAQELDMEQGDPVPHPEEFPPPPPDEMTGPPSEEPPPLPTEVIADNAHAENPPPPPPPNEAELPDLVKTENSGSLENGDSMVVRAEVYDAPSSGEEGKQDPDNSQDVVQEVGEGGNSKAPADGNPPTDVVEFADDGNTESII